MTPLQSHLITALITAAIAVTVTYFILTGYDRSRDEIERLTKEIEQLHIDAETALFEAVEGERATIRKQDSLIIFLLDRDAVITEQLKRNKSRGNEKRISILDLDSTGIQRELRGVFARRGSGQ
jgi:hypothetical protein